jgi:signal transduction histidine kinase
MLRLLKKLLFLLALCLGPMVSGQPSTAVLTNCLDVLNLSPERARENRPVRVRGTVTTYIPGSHLCFVQDESAGIYIQPSPWPKELNIGEVVEVTGVSAEGRFSPIIHMGVIRPTGEKRALLPRRVSIEELNTGRFDCQYVEVQGVLQKVAADNVIELEIAVGGSRCVVLIFSGNNAPTNAVDSLVRVRGVAGTRYAGDRLSGFGIFLQDTSYLEILKTGPPLFTQPVRSLGKLAWYSAEGSVDHRVRVQGTVSLSWPGESFFVQGEGGSLRVAPVNAKEMPRAGDLVDAIGFVRNPTGPGTALAHALWKKIGSTNTPGAKPMRITDLLANPPDGQFVSAEGELMSLSATGSGSIAILHDEGQVVRAFCKEAIPPDYLRSRVLVTGVLTTPPGTAENSTEHCLWLGATSNVTVLRNAVQPVAKKGSDLLLAAAATIALIFAAFLWASNKRAQQIGDAARVTTDQLRAVEKEVAQLKDGRERLGRDLHDHIIQSIYAVGLNLEDTRQTLSDPGKTDNRIKTALSEINDVIRELRNVILGLESNTIQPKEFRTALKSLALTLGHAESSRIRLDIDQEALEALSPVQATELIHVAREAMSNSIRHGQAETTTLGLHTHQDWLRFTVEDDGNGFDPKGAEPKGYGLRNMAKRAEDLGAKFTITAQEGLGTRIVLDIPKQKQHFSNSETHSRPPR